MENYIMRSLLLAGILAALPATAWAQNLVPNGNFEAGNNGFTSDYEYAPALNTTEDQYTVRTDPFPWNPSFVSVGDHTSGAGQMLVGNGSPLPNQIVWQSSVIPISSLTNYFFEAFVMNVCCSPSYTGGNSAPSLTFSISLDGGPAQVLDTLTIPLSPPGIWYGLSTGFNSGSATNASLFLINANTAQAGNDFAVDDIFLGTRSTVNGVPEPATWAMLLIGFGAIGGAMRRRTSKRRNALSFA